MYSSFHLPIIKNMSTCALNICWKRILPLEYVLQFQCFKINYDFFVKHHDISTSRPHSIITPVPHLHEIA